MTVVFKRLRIEDMAAAARIHRAAFDDRLPWLAGRHTPEEDAEFFRSRVYCDCVVWGAFQSDVLAGFIAFRRDWIDQLYVLPRAQRRGIGTSLLSVAKNAEARLHLWTFSANAPARRFYENHGFVALKETNGSGNEEREPDILYCWTGS